MAKKAYDMWGEARTAKRRMMSAEEQVDARRSKKRMRDCELPDGFVLLTPEPRQMVMDGLAIWGFALGYVAIDATTHLPVYWRHEQRYLLTVADDIQLQWALHEFSRELEAFGYEVGMDAEMQRKRIVQRKLRNPRERAVSAMDGLANAA